MELISCFLFHILNDNEVTVWLFCSIFSEKNKLFVKVITRIEWRTLNFFFSSPLSFVTQGKRHRDSPADILETSWLWLRSREAQWNENPLQACCTSRYFWQRGGFSLAFKCNFCYWWNPTFLNREIHLWAVLGTSSTAEQQTCTLTYELSRGTTTGLWFAYVMVKPRDGRERTRNVFSVAGCLLPWASLLIRALLLKSWWDPHLLIAVTSPGCSKN